MKKRTVELMAVGAAAGAVNGLFGTGGGTVMVLALARMCPNLGGRELFANVCASVLPMAAVSALTYSSFSPPDLWEAVSVGGAALAGGTVGSLLLGRMKPKVLKLIFSAVMTVGGVIMLVR